MALKFIPRALGKFLISISITVFIATFLAISLADNTDSLKESLTSELSSEDLLEDLIDTSEFSIAEIKELCSQNPNQEGCDEINDPSKLVEEQITSELDPILNEIQSLKPAMENLRILSIIVFLLGIGLLYLGTLNISLTLYKAFSTTLVSSIFYILFYKFASTSIPSLAKQATASQQDVPQELLNVAVNAVTEWMLIPIGVVIKVSIILIAISLPLTILFFFLKRKYTDQSKTDTKISADKKPNKK
ncbi:MAG: hypothetical protein CMH64_01920 [Nanoarchaeota archaeon]|nr:hypothetical protein [Nanoarchaeota archaeon]|tara:strand:- start:591 stop:1331 length:741 start_codon:yes stop_codon:yes gene_type:complete